MRITGGKFLNRKLEVYKKGVRPTTDFVREALFSSLGDIRNYDILDLFGGSGALTIESISRGANSATIIEQNYSVLSVIKRNLNLLKIENVKLLKADSLRFIKKEKRKFDLIFIDPPYSKEEFYPLLLSIIEKKALLKDNGRVICEMSASFEFKNENYDIIKNKKYGSSRIIIFKLKIE